MKMYKRIIAFIHIIILYHFTIVFYSTTIVTLGDTLSKTQSSGDKSFFLLFSGNLFCPATQTENIVKDFNEPSSSSPKNQFNGCVDRFKLEKAFFHITFSKYVFHTVYVIKRFQPTDIIFPFHYFW